MRSFGTSGELVLQTARHQLVLQLALRAEVRIRLRDRELAFFDGGQEVDLVRDRAVLHATVRRLEEAVLVGAGVDRQRVDQADVRTFRRFDRAHATVVGRVHVAHFEAGTFARQTARAEGRSSAEKACPSIQGPDGHSGHAGHTGHLRRQSRSRTQHRVRSPDANRY